MCPKVCEEQYNFAYFQQTCTDDSLLLTQFSPYPGGSQRDVVYEPKDCRVSAMSTAVHIEPDLTPY
jgi:hypothetical protein